MKTWIAQLLPIIAEYKDGDSEPLDGNAVDDLVHILKAKINLQEGNITEAGYDYLLNYSGTQLQRMDKASHILCEFEDGRDCDIVTIEDQIKTIEAVEDGTMFIDDVGMVMVWEKLEYAFTVEQFLSEIS